MNLKVINQEMINMAYETPTSQQTLAILFDRQAIIDTVNGYVMAADSNDWEQCSACFAEDLLLQHITETDPTKPDPEPEKVSRFDVMKSWAELFEAFSSTQHMLTNHRVELDGDRAICYSYVEAIHVAKAPLNATRHHHVFGTYRHTLARQNGRWVITEVYHKQKYALGNTAIFGH
jgi:ketosteroid isomerase-like protein